MSVQTTSLPFKIHDQRITPFVLIIFLLLTIYFGSLHNAWQLDDLPNIVDNSGLHIHDLMPESLWVSFFANQGNAPELYRPLPCLTFALNWYAGQDNPFGYHVVNLGCHIATAWSLYLLIIILMKVYWHPRLHPEREIENVALLATILWAANPIQTQAVTYIVQRMALMAALFYVLGILYFVKARIAKTNNRRLAYGAGCFLFFLCGIGSKENAVLLPVSIFLIEWIFFRHASLTFLVRPKTMLVGTFFAIGILLIVYFTIGLPFDFIITKYDERPFSMIERLMTEPRIVLGYLSQIFFPIPDRLSIVHDVTLFSSIFQPWTTLPALVLVLGLNIGAIMSARRYPLLAFAVLFFFINHIVESTLLPLELVFEHRNYLPSFFLFLPIATGFHAIVTRDYKHSRLMHIMVTGIMIMTIFALGYWTHTRNKDWATWESLWLDASKKAPYSSRPLVNLGVHLAWRDHPTPANYRHAIVLFKHSLTLAQNRIEETSEILGNIASVYFFQGNNDKAIETYYRAIDIDPGFLKNRFDLIKPLISSGLFEEAELQARYLILDRPDNLNYQILLTFILLWQEKNEKALACCQSAMKIEPTNKKLLMNLGLSLTRTGYLERGRWYLEQVINTPSSGPIPLFAIIENRIRANDCARAEIFANKLVKTLPVSTIAESLNELSESFLFVPISVDMIRPVIEDAITYQLNKVDNHCEATL